MSAVDISPLLEPIALRGLTLRNRVAMAPMTREFSPSGIPGEDVAEYYRRRARGGVGVIFTEGTGIDDPVSVDGTAVPLLHGADAVAGWRRVVEAVHAEGGAIMPQLWHQGPLRKAEVSAVPDHVGRRPSGLWGTPGFTSYSDAYVEAMAQETAPMTDDEIAEAIASYARAASTAREIGFDGVAIHGAHGYLIDAFLWSETNKRTDRFGGDIRGRTEFGREVVAAIRAAVGQEMPIVFRFSQHKQQDYDARFAQTPDELGVALNILADAGVDLFDASSRRFSRPAFEGSELTQAGWARELTGKPTMTVGGIGLNNWLQDTFKKRGETLATNNLDEVMRLFEKGEFDMIAVGRALISDPDWLEKARSGADFHPYDRTSLDRLA
jgi:2,4-dienoyl-CoA reductase-like NADH-dependent reductase (Old Yellow Enzyme family)